MSELSDWLLTWFYFSFTLGYFAIIFLVCHYSPFSLFLRPTCKYVGLFQLVPLVFIVLFLIYLLMYSLNLLVWILSLICFPFCQLSFLLYLISDETHLPNPYFQLLLYPLNSWILRIPIFLKPFYTLLFILMHYNVIVDNWSTVSSTSLGYKLGNLRHMYIPMC